MQFTNEQDRKLFDRIQPHLVNTNDNLNSVSMFCPFCQIGGTRKNSKKWSPSQRKGYILNNHSKGYIFAVFYCHNSQCESRNLSHGTGGLSLEVFANYIIGNQICSRRNFTPSSPVSSQDKECKSAKVEKFSGSKITVLPPSDRNQQSGLGAALDRKLKIKNKHRDNLFN